MHWSVTFLSYKCISPSFSSPSKHILVNHFRSRIVQSYLSSHFLCFPVGSHYHPAFAFSRYYACFLCYHICWKETYKVKLLMQNSKMYLDFSFWSWTHCREHGLIICNFPNPTLTKLYWSILLSFCRVPLHFSKDHRYNTYINTFVK